jgi:hypothetical protein
MAKRKEATATLFKESDAEVAPVPKAKPPAKVGTVKLPAPAAPMNLLASIVAAAADPNCQPDKMHALLDARDRLMAQEAHVQFVSAYIDMQEELPTIDAKGRIEIEAKRQGAKKQSTPYATYQEINKVTKPILKKHRFGMMMLPDVGENGTGVVMRGQLVYVCDTQYGRMVHAERCTIAAPLETSGSKNNVQGVGSSLSYTKRYCAVALLNLISEAKEDADDDATGKGTTITAEQVQTIVEMAAEIGCPGPHLLSHLNKTKPKGAHDIQTIEELPPTRYKETLAALDGYAANKKARQQADNAQDEQR